MTTNNIEELIINPIKIKTIKQKSIMKIYYPKED
jgi:hypothetical protein